MSFDIDDSLILFEGRAVAQLLPTLPLGYRRTIEDIFVSDALRMSDDEVEALTQKEREEEYEAGRLAGIEEAKNDAGNALDDEREAIEAEAFAAGRAQALQDLNAAKDVAKVDALLRALREIHNAGLPLIFGYEVEGSYKKRPAKTSEVKAIARRMTTDARLAINTYESE